MMNADTEEVRAVVDHVVEGRDDIAGPHVTAAQSGGGAVDLRDTVDPILAVLTSQGIAKGGFDFARQVVPRGRKGIVHPFEHGEGLAILQRLDDLATRARTKNELRHATRLDSF